MYFVKMHGTGNDFVMIDGRGLPERDWGALARRMCDRHFGAGADGLILLEESAIADLRMRMWNPDGSEAEMCGNGIRCFTKLALEQGIVPGSREQFTAETGAGVLALRPVWHKRRVKAVAVNMGAPAFNPEDVPVSAPAAQDGWVHDYTLKVNGASLSIACVSMGNPHAVYFSAEDPDRFPLAELGPKVEHHELFPRRVNFHVAQVLDRERIRMRTWERGAGMTLACGTGACATAVVGRRLGLTEDAVEVRVPGGVLTIRWLGSGEVFMTGPAETVFSGEWAEPE